MLDSIFPRRAILCRTGLRVGEASIRRLPSPASRPEFQTGSRILNTKWLGDSTDARRMAGLLVGFLGVVVLLGFNAPRSGLEWIGVGCMLLAVPAYALAPLVIQRFLHGEGLGFSAASLAIAALVLSPADLRFLPPSVPFVRAIT